MASSERASLTVSPVAPTNASSSVVSTSNAPAGLVHLADDHAGADPPAAVHERQVAEQRVQQRGLARAVRPDDRHPLRPRDLEVDRAEA